MLPEIFELFKFDCIKQTDIKGPDQTASVCRQTDVACPCPHMVKGTFLRTTHYSNDYHFSNCVETCFSIKDTGFFRFFVHSLQVVISPSQY